MGQAQSRGPDPPNRRDEDESSMGSQRLSRAFSSRMERDAAVRPRSLNPFTRSSSSPQLPDQRPPVTTHSTGQRRPYRISRSRTSITSSLPSFFRRHSFRSSPTDPASSQNLSLSTMTEPPRSQDSFAQTSRNATQPTSLAYSDSDAEASAENQHANSESTWTSDNAGNSNRVGIIGPARSRLGQERTILPRFLPGGRRSARPRGEDQATMLSRLLSVAAAATAASLMGDDQRSGSQGRTMPSDSDDGSFDGFLQALQNGRIASALRQSNTGSTDEPGETNRISAPLNFFRMFRFGSSFGDNRNEHRPDRMDVDGNGTGDGSHGRENRDNEDGRMVPIIIVGIRSINPNNVSSHDIPPFIDALSNFPTPIVSTGEATIDSILRPPQNGTRFSHRRRASLSGLGSHPPNLENHRQQRLYESFRPWMTSSEFPAGPRPPPSTPASPGMSTVSSGNTTPAETPSSTAPSRRHSFARRAGNNHLFAATEEPLGSIRTPRPRRLSESDFARFGSGSSRRNGIVEPDTTTNEGSRSWIIYVLGGSYPENHPILTTPSLFTDSPTYEDMLLLSALLGPAKPPIASESDVASAPGLFNIVAESAGLVAISAHSEERFALAVSERCLICLCEFEAKEVMRRLLKCDHMFHRECVDQVSFYICHPIILSTKNMQWLMTGRNSCPLCRAKGVDQKEGSHATSAEEETPTASSRA